MRSKHHCRVREAADVRNLSVYCQSSVENDAWDIFHSPAMKELLCSSAATLHVCVCLHEWSARPRAAHVPLPAAISLTQLPRSASTDAPLFLTFSSWPKCWKCGCQCWFADSPLVGFLTYFFFILGLFALLAASLYEMNLFWLFCFFLCLTPHRRGATVIHWLTRCSTMNNE